MAYNDISKASTNKYRSNFDLVQIRLEKGERDKIAAHAKARGESMNTFIVRAINSMIESENTQDGTTDD